MEQVLTLRQRLDALNKKPSMFSMHKFLLDMIERIESLELELDQNKRKVDDLMRIRSGLPPLAVI